MWGRRVQEELRVLLVDPDDERLARVAVGLRGEGFEVVALARRDAAVPLFGAFRPDAVVMAVSATDEVPAALARRLRSLSSGTAPLTDLVPTEERALRRQCLEKGLGLDVMRPDAGRARRFATFAGGRGPPSRRPCRCCRRE